MIVHFQRILLIKRYIFREIANIVVYIQENS